MASKRKTKQVVEIDNRLTDLFHARRAGKDTATDAATTSTAVQETTATDNNLSWLNQFKSVLATEGSPADSSSKKSSVYKLSLKGMRPFWALDNPKEMTALWKRSKSALMKDCQKQRKAALRKTIRR